MEIVQSIKKGPFFDVWHMDTDAQIWTDFGTYDLLPKRPLCAVSLLNMVMGMITTIKKVLLF